MADQHDVYDSTLQLNINYRPIDAKLWTYVKNELHVQ